MPDAAVTLRFVAAAVAVGVGVGVNVAVAVGVEVGVDVAVGVEVGVGVGVGVPHGGVVAGRISSAIVPHRALALSEPLTGKADEPPK